MQTIEAIAEVETDFKSKKPLPKQATRQQKSDAKHDLATVFEIVLKTLHPDWSVSENLKLASESMDELRRRIGGDKVLDEGLKSLISQYKCVENRIIKRAMLGEIAKKLSFASIVKLVDSGLSRHE